MDMVEEEMMDFIEGRRVELVAGITIDMKMLEDKVADVLKDFRVVGTETPWDIIDEVVIDGAPEVVADIITEEVMGFVIITAAEELLDTLE
ncbi:MAG: hypothetical protein M1836_001381 [Candelina mexicana]|nr:MAG: hypothetical protein M1836_001381 [Candelina mexicana]